jgi:hypothetical protein
VAGGSMFRLWWRMDEEGRQRVWRLYGWFTALMLCGSCFGAVSWAARMVSQVNFYRANDLFSSLVNFFEGKDLDLKITGKTPPAVISQTFSFLALNFSWGAARQVTYATEFLFLSAAQLMVLDRMSDFVTSQGDSARKWWVIGGRAVMAAVVLCNAVGLAASIAAAVFIQKSADACSAASMLYASSNTRNNAIKIIMSARSDIELALNVLSVQSFCEAAVLLLIVLVFTVIGVACIRRLGSTLTLLNTAGADMAVQHRMRQRVVNQALALGKRLRQEVVVTTSFVFVAFLLRSVVATLVAVAYQSQDTAKTCPGKTSLCDSSCYNVYTHIVIWNANTPEFVTTVVLISSPLTLLVALWGMYSKITLQLMRSRQRQMAPTRASPVGQNVLRLREVTEEVLLT